MTAPSETRVPSPATLPLLLVHVAVIVLVVAYAWVGDDAFITLRTVDNFVEGRGLGYNAGERVQAYTHPLWLLLISVFYFFTREPFYTVIAVSVLVTAATLRLVERRFTRSGYDAVVVLLVLGMSRAFVDYSTSGLENPLSHLLVVVFAAGLLAGAPLRSLVFVASLGALCRLDLALVFAPGLVLRVVRDLRDRGRGHLGALVRAALVGAAPLLLWEAFSLLYYGSLVPNTALAKLGHGVPKSEVLRQGMYYFADSLKNDPLTLVAIAAALAVPWITRRREHAALAAGMLAYLVYVWWIGGDFMSGRFFTVPLVCAALLLSRIVADRPRAILPAAGIVLGLGFLATVPTPLWGGKANLRGGKIDARGIADERGIFSGGSALFNTSVESDGPDNGWRHRGESSESALGPGEIRAARTEPNLGFAGYYGPPDVALIDPFGLADPLLARLPARRDFRWRIGHFTRAIPDGYLESVRTGEDRLRDRNLGELWRTIELVTRGPLLSRERLAAIWALNTGAAGELVDHETYRFWQAPRFQLDDLRTVPGDGPIHAFTETGAFVQLPGPRSDAAVRLVMSPGKYAIVFRSAGRTIGEVRVRTVAEPAARKKKKRKKGEPAPKPRLELQTIDVPADVRARGFDELQILPRSGHKPYYVEGVALLDESGRPQ